MALFQMKTEQNKLKKKKKEKKNDWNEFAADFEQVSHFT